MQLHPRWLPVLVAGYMLYRVAGAHRERRGAGPPGFATMPDRLVTDGPYAVSRNPMYLGHLVFLGGLIGLTRSPFALLFGVRQLFRFRRRVAFDEDRLERAFGDEYRAYVARVPRWFGPYT
jgi:protein-S-isoprenylcysteine O-methyltransferase Ste14